MSTHFKNIFESELLKQIELIKEIEIGKGEIILKENAYIKEIPLVIEGKIKVRKTDENGKELTLYHIEPGESCILSITSCMNDKQSNAEAITESSTKLVIIPATKVKEWMDEYKSWRKFVLHLYHSRMYDILTLVDSISFKQTDSRLYNKLKELQQKNGNEIFITHQKLANELGTAREVVSRLLKQLENDKLIVLERGVIKIISPL